MSAVVLLFVLFTVASASPVPVPEIEQREGGGPGYW